MTSGLDWVWVPANLRHGTSTSMICGRRGAVRHSGCDPLHLAAFRGAHRAIAELIDRGASAGAPPRPPMAASHRLHGRLRGTARGSARAAEHGRAYVAAARSADGTTPLLPPPMEERGIGFRDRGEPRTSRRWGGAGGRHRRPRQHAAAHRVPPRPARRRRRPDAGASAAIADGTGQTPLEIAEMWGHLDVEAALLAAGSRERTGERHARSAQAVPALFGTRQAGKMRCEPVAGSLMERCERVPA